MKHNHNVLNVTIIYGDTGTGKTLVATALERYWRANRGQTCAVWESEEDSKPQFTIANVLRDCKTHDHVIITVTDNLHACNLWWRFPRANRINLHEADNP